MTAAEVEDPVVGADLQLFFRKGHLDLGLRVITRGVEGPVVFVEVLAVPGGVGFSHACILTAGALAAIDIGRSFRVCLKSLDHPWILQ